MISLTLALLQTQTITFYHKADFLKNVVPELGQAVGKTLKVDDTVKWQIVYTRVKDVSSADLLKNFAAATHTTWSHDAEGNLLLVHDKAADDARAAEERVACRKLWKSLLGSYDAYMAGLKAAKQAGQPGDPVVERYSSDTKKAEVGLLSGMSEQTIVNLKLDTRTVFSNQPTAVQKGISVNWELVKGLVAASQMAASSGPAADSVDGEETGQSKEVMERVLEVQRQRAAHFTRNLPPAKVDIVVDRFEGGFNVEIKVFDSEGYEVFDENPSWETGEDVSTGEDEKPEVGASFKIDKDIAQLVTQVIRSKATDRNLLFDKMRAEFSNVAETDPFMRLGSAVLDGYCSVEPGVQVIQDLTNTRLYNSSETVTEQMVWSNLDLKKPKAGDWQLTSNYVNTQQIDRAWVAEHIKKAVSTPIDLDEASAWAVKLGDAPAGFFMSGLYRWFGTPSPGLFPALQFYAALTPEQKRTAKSSGTLQMGALKGQALSFVSQAIYGSEPLVYRGGSLDHGVSAFRNYDSEAEIMQFLAYMGPDYLNEVTEAMPNGVPSDGLIQFEYLKGTLFTTSPYSINTANQVDGAIETSIIGALRNQVNPGMPATTMYQANCESLRIMLQPIKEYGGVYRLNMGKIDYPTKPWTLTDFQKAYPDLVASKSKQAEAFKATIEKQYKDIGNGGASQP